MPKCDGNLADHCCYIDGSICRFLEENTILGRRWVCGLRRELGSWRLVHEDPRYVADVKPTMDRLGGTQCGDWPPKGQTCSICGVTG
jgi:hypothetical protein